MGAIASGGVWVLNEDVIQALNPPIRVVEAVAARELQELERRERAYRGDRPALEVQRPHRDPGGRRARDRLDDAGRRHGRAPARARSTHRGRPDRGALDLRRSSASRPTSASAASRPTRSTPSGSGTRTSPRPPTRRSVTSSNGPTPGRWPQRVHDKEQHR